MFPISSDDCIKVWKFLGIIASEWKELLLVSILSDDCAYFLE